MTTNASEREPMRAPDVLKLGQLTMTSERDRDLHVIAVAGELDLANAPEVEDELKRVEATDAQAIVLDLSGLTFIDSTGIRLVIAAHMRSRAEGRLKLSRGQAAVQRAFELSGVNELLPFAE